ncbi:hypothetical protein LDL76_06030 [Salegentibacter mishustinae]|jgi:hypothetical protein|uniref:hypothetical protein n=1 Tax=Salegentibacter mishustinae TaxID=270918 RepID=UPI001CE091BE|nr:hypothetical protein [Salegentibacter mishustinae]UBZ08266.1 hypothetical protein LDL76_06030 [Salegentibacter mishustinae]
MSDDELADVLKYSSPDTLYIITWNNLLKKLLCPFQVVVKHQIGELEKGEVVWVNSVKVTARLKTVFIVKGRAYYYSHFEIVEPV